MKKEGFQFIHLLILVPPAIIFLVVNFFMPSANCRTYEKFKKEDYRGIVLRKFLNDKNHYHETVTIETGGKKFNILLIKERAFYNCINEGDSIIKTIGSDVIEIKNDKKQQSFKLNFGCSE